MTRRHFGNVRKFNSGRWQAAYWHDGTRHVATATFSSKADALAYLASVETDLHRGAWVDPRAGSVRLRKYSDEWLSRKTHLSVSTIELYRFLLDRHVLPHLGETALAALTPSKVRGWSTSSIAREHPSTAAKAYRLLSNIMRTAATDGLIVVSPCRVAGAGVEHAPERPIATLAEVDALAESITDRFRLVVLLAMWCQLRRGELLALRRQDIDLLHMRLTICQSRIVTSDGRSIVKSPKTSAGRRVVSIPPHLADPIRAHLDTFVAPHPDALIITGRTGVPVTPAVLQKSWSRARNAIGRPDLHLHDLRHTGLTLAAAAGATTAELMHRAGHSSPAAALRYQHATQDRDRVLAEALSTLVRPTTVLPISSARSGP